MSNPDRKLVTVRRIDRIEPHPNADRLELARIGGWQCVVGKGEFSEGQLVLYFEPDSFLPLNDPRFEFLRDRGVKTMRIGNKEVEGHVLRTIKLRGEYSQGLVLDAVSTLGTSEETAAELCASKINMTKALGVAEYEQPSIAGSPQFIGRYDSRLAPRTDAERVQNIEEDVWAIAKKAEYFVSVKADGTSITICNDPHDGETKVFSHNNRFDLTAKEGVGKTAFETAKKEGILEFCEANPGWTVQAELCGPKIGGNRLRLSGYEMFVFSVYDMERGIYLDPYDLFWDFADADLRKFLVPKVDVDLSDFPTTLDFIDYVDGLRGNITDGCLDEGLVVHIIGQGDATDDEWWKLRQALGSQLQIKCISRAYMAKAKG